MPKIKLLSPILANQIAAGEVVERPASVVKELIENSIDAGATKIEIELAKGGHKRIHIQDDGCGIEKDQLPLALSRHATSKITTLDDLEKIGSLGFRGEALASVSSVARLTLISNTAIQNQGWQAFTEGSEMEVKVSPAAHPVGTSVIVEDLFFNTPARRKFLKTEKTEFSHVEEFVKRISLANPKITFTLTHNGKRIKHFNGLKADATDHIKRLSEACGNQFSQSAIELNSEYQDITLHGWLSFPEHLGANIEHQYFFVNGRVVRDKLIQHAMRQACTENLPEGQGLNYVLFLTLPADHIDVNVHPAKHEIRFHQARLIHDFILSAIADSVAQTHQGDNGYPADKGATEPPHNYITAPREQSAHHIQEQPSRLTQPYRPSQGPSAAAKRHYSELLTTPSLPNSSIKWIPGDAYNLILFAGERHWLLSIRQLIALFMQHKIRQGVVTQPLLLPISLAVEQSNSDVTDEISTQYKALGFDLQFSRKKLLIKSVLAGFRDVDWATILAHVFSTELDHLDHGESRLLMGMTQTDISFSPVLLNSALEWLSSLEEKTSLALLDEYAKPLDITQLMENNIE